MSAYNSLILVLSTLYAGFSLISDLNGSCRLFRQQAQDDIAKELASAVV